MGAAPARVREILERINCGHRQELRAYIKDRHEFEEIGNRMLHEREQGVALSLKAGVNGALVEDGRPFPY
jgi:hypothetical protein